MLRTRLFRFLFVAHFFLPYIPGTRIRVEVLVGYLCLVLLPVVLRRLQPGTRALLATSAACVLWAGVRVMLANLSFTDRAAMLTGYAFPLTSAATFLVVRRWLGPLEELIGYLLVISIPINLVAVAQALDPYSSFNTAIFGMYGGYNITSFDVGSLAEFEVKFAGRCTAIFNGCHALALFDVMVVACAVCVSRGEGAGRGRQLLAAIAGIGGIVGGALAASKSFYYGGVVAFLALLPARRIRPAIAVAVIISLGAFALTRVLQEATVADSTMAYLEMVEDPTFDNTLGSRFGSQGFLTGTLDKVLDHPIILGVGEGPDDPTTNLADSAYLPLIVVGGLPLLLLFYGSLAAILVPIVRRAFGGDSRLAPLAATAATFVAVGVGIPTFQTGRIAPLFLILALVGLWGEGAETVARAPAAGAGARGSGPASPAHVPILDDVQPTR